MRRASSRGRARRLRGTPVGLTAIDHIVGNVELGGMDRWVHFFAETMGFTQLVHFDDKTISTEYSALMSKVMQDGTGRVKFPINEPATGKRKSQIQEYLDYYRGPGRPAHRVRDRRHRRRPCPSCARAASEFLRVPPTYYEDLESRVGKIDEPVDKLAELGILADRDDEGYLLQIFTEPSRTGRRCSSRSSSGTARRDSAKATSSRCSRRSSASRRGAATSSERGLTCTTSRSARFRTSGTRSSASPMARCITRS